MRRRGRKVADGTGPRNTALKRRIGEKQMSHSHNYESEDMDYQGGSMDRFSRRSTDSSDAQRRPTHTSRRRGKSPQSVNGIHRRRRRKMSW